MILLIDNYDSFTFNLVHYFKMLGETVSVFRNDAINISEIKKLNPSHIVLSPGPRRPEDAGITLPCIQEFAGIIPILGVCLGHQAIGQCFGAEIINAKEVRHGKTSPIYHHSQGIFKNIPHSFLATRYHSLVIDAKTLSDDFIVTAWTEKESEPEEIMGIQHKHFNLHGVQFHPEAILTEWGMELLLNFVNSHCN